MVRANRFVSNKSELRLFDVGGLANFIISVGGRSQRSEIRDSGMARDMRKAPLLRFDVPELRRY